MALLKLLGWVQVMSYEYRYYINDPVEWYDTDSNHQPSATATRQKIMSPLRYRDANFRQSSFLELQH